MKRTLTTALVALGFASTAAFADVVIYNGSTVTKRTGDGQAETLVKKTTEIIDLETNTIVTINAFVEKAPKKKDSQKKFEVLPSFPALKAVVKGKKDVETTVFTTADSDPTGVAFGSFVGTNAKKGVKIKDGATEAAQLPSSLKVSGTVVNVGAEASDLITVSGVLKVNAASSVKANALTPTEGTLLEAAVAMVVTDLEAKGYTNVVPVPVPED